MKAEDIFFKMLSKYDQSYHEYYHKKGDEKSSTTYLSTKVDL